MSIGECVPIKLEDGSVVLVMVKRGHTLTETEIEVLREFYELLRKAKEAQQ